MFVFLSFNSQKSKSELPRHKKSIARATIFSPLVPLKNTQIQIGFVYLCAVCTNRSQIGIFFDKPMYFTPFFWIFEYFNTFFYIFFKTAFSAFKAYKKNSEQLAISCSELIIIVFFGQSGK